MDIRSGDTVIVVSGEEKGKVGRVIAVFPKKGRVLVEKVNMIKPPRCDRHQTQMQGGIIEKEAPLPLCKVALYDPKSKSATRVRYRVRYEKDGDRQVKIKDRISARTGEVLERPIHKS